MPTTLPQRERASPFYETHDRIFVIGIALILTLLLPLAIALMLPVSVTDLAVPGL
jgi:hypothetical protein